MFLMLVSQISLNCVCVFFLFNFSVYTTECHGFCVHFLTGILQREQESSVVYGSVDSGTNVATHEKFLELVSSRLGCTV